MTVRVDWRRWAPISIGLVAVLCYANALQNGFALDDNGIIADNASVHSLSALWRAYANPYWPDGNGGQYRPLAIASFALDWALCIAAGATWHGQQTEPGAVVYIAAEGVTGLYRRIQAWTHARNLEPPDRIRFVPGIEAAGACDPKTGLLALRTSQLYEGKAQEYMQKKDWQRALSYMDKSVTLAPNNCWKYKKRKDIHLALGNVENAVKDLQHFTETLCATSADREELSRLRSQQAIPGRTQ